MTQIQERLAFRINDTCRVLGVGRSSIYKMIGDGRLKAIKVAGRTLIPRSEIERLLKVTANNA